ncbi:GDSL esterase/lipase At5g45950 [Linum perenne]
MQIHLPTSTCLPNSIWGPKFKSISYRSFSLFNKAWSQKLTNSNCAYKSPISVSLKEEQQMSRIAMSGLTILVLMLMSGADAAVVVSPIKVLASKYNVTSVLVFGDSSVDPGNNNRLRTPMKGNFPPYGKDFFHGRPTGRFSNGRLATDFIAEALGFTKIIPAFLDPRLKPADLLHGVSFASAASGYDELTANYSQLEYFRHYKLHLIRLVGATAADEIVKNAVFVLSMGTNDFLQNYFLEPERAKQFTVVQYQEFLSSQMLHNVKEMHRMGLRRLVVVGVPPLGCMPLVKTLNGQDDTCVASYNHVSSTFNAKTKSNLALLRRTLGIKDAYVDCFAVIQNAVNNPKAYGFVEVRKGCCGTGSIEYGDTCKGLSTCEDASKYAFWDAVHPSQKMYEFIANEAVKSISASLFS